MVFRFLSRLILIDTIRNRRYYFVCNTWLAADIGDGSVNRTFTKATKKELRDAEHLFFTHTSKYVRHRFQYHVNFFRMQL